MISRRYLCTAVGLLTVVVLSGAGCATSGMPTDSAASAQRVKYLRIEPGADLSQYTKLMPGGLDVFYPQRDEPPFAEDLQYIRNAFRSAFLNAVGEDYRLTNQAGPGVMRVRAQVIETGLIGLAQDAGPGAAMPRGNLLLIMEMYDAETGKLLARASDESANAAVDAELTGTALVDVAAGYWAGLFREWLDRSVSMAAVRK